MGSALRYAGKSITAAMGLELIVFSFQVGAAGATSLIRDLGSNAVKSITRDSTGSYTIILNQPWPAQMVVGEGSLSLATTDHSAATSGADVNVTGYVATTGTFTLQTRTDDGDGTYTVEDITDGSRVQVKLYMEQAKALVQP